MNHHPYKFNPRWQQSVAWGIRKRCPRCGEGSLYTQWTQLFDRCPVCELALKSRESDAWFFMLITNAILTGVIGISMFVYLPKGLWERTLMVGTLAIILIFGSLPNRKGFAIALDYIIYGDGQE